MKPQDVKIHVNNSAGLYESAGKVLTDKADLLYRIVIAEVLPVEGERYAIMRYLFGKSHHGEMSDGEKHGVLEFLQLVRMGEKYVPNSMRVSALRSCYREEMIEVGQEELPTTDSEKKLLDELDDYVPPF